MTDKIRQTGRTTRMLHQAVIMAYLNSDQNIYVVAMNKSQIKDMQHMIEKMNLLVNPPNLQFLTKDSNLHGINKDFLFIDHYVREQCSL